MTVKLLTEHHLEFLSLTDDCKGSPESTLVKMPHCWKSHVAAQIQIAAAVSSHETPSPSETGIHRFAHCL